MILVGKCSLLSFYPKFYKLQYPIRYKCKSRAVRILRRLEYARHNTANKSPGKLWCSQQGCRHATDIRQPWAFFVESASSHFHLKNLLLNGHSNNLVKHHIKEALYYIRYYLRCMSLSYCDGQQRYHIACIAPLNICISTSLDESEPLCKRWMQRMQQ